MKKWNWMYSVMNDSMSNIDPSLCGDDELTTSPPPEIDMSDAWVDSLTVPDAEEMAQMDENADALWFDLMEDTL